mmetsp:Transcript_37122/g.68166  ORF Transcript_37122/g.68166 Transcript_37122/m.68166 type:complete len:263 (-) Transcript_37122:245-1033(-)
MRFRFPEPHSTFEGPYQVYTDGHQRCTERNLVYLGMHRLSEEEEGVLFVEVTTDIDALLLIGIHHEGESRAVWGNASNPFLLLEGKDTENATLSEELGSSKLVIRETTHWMGSRPVAYLTDITIISKIANLRFRQDMMALSAWTNLAHRYHEGVKVPHGVPRAVLKAASIQAAVIHNSPLALIHPLFEVPDEAPQCQLGGQQQFATIIQGTSIRALGSVSITTSATTTIPCVDCRGMASKTEAVEGRNDGEEVGRKRVVVLD